MFVDQWRKPCSILVPHRVTLLAKLGECRLNVDRVPQRNHIDHESKRTQLILLPLPVALAQFAAFAMKNDAGKAVPPLPTVELGQGTPALAFIVNKIEAMQCLVDAPEFRDRLRQPRRGVADLQCAHDAGCGHPAQQQRTGQTQHVVPLERNALQAQPVLGDQVELSIIGRRIDTPESRTADVRQSGAEPVA